MNDWSTLNDTLEEQLRRELIDLKKHNDALQNRIAMLENSVKTEQEQKYNAYKRISELVNPSHNEQT
jgi:predicted transport protein